jgi:hypothetical protein
MQNFLCSQISNSSDQFSSPESLAWQILTDDINDFCGIVLPCVSAAEAINASLLNADGANKSNNNLQSLSRASYDSLAEQFEILITIYMEMVYGLLKINHINSLLNDDGELESDVNCENTFNPDLSQFTIKELYTVFSEKLRKIRVGLSVTNISDSDNSNSEYYCKILLRNVLEGKHHFTKYCITHF